MLEHRIFRTMPAMPGAAEVLWRLSDAGVWIRIITHRLYVNWGHATAVADTVDWLDAAGIPYRDLCFLGAPQVEADCYVEDAPAQRHRPAQQWGPRDRLRPAVQPRRRGPAPSTGPAWRIWSGRA